MRSALSVLFLVAAAAVAQDGSAPVQRGRYGVNAQGVGGVENGPPIFDLAACAPRAGGGSSTRTYCDEAGNCTSHGLWGWIRTSR